MDNYHWLSALTGDTIQVAIASILQDNFATCMLHAPHYHVGNCLEPALLHTTLCWKLRASRYKLKTVRKKRGRLRILCLDVCVAQLYGNDDDNEQSTSKNKTDGAKSVEAQNSCQHPGTNEKETEA